LGGLLNIQQHDVQWHVRFSTLLISPLFIHDALSIVNATHFADRQWQWLSIILWLLHSVRCCTKCIM